MLVIVCLDDIFGITDHFVTKFGMVMQHYKPECHAVKKGIIIGFFWGGYL